MILAQLRIPSVTIDESKLLASDDALHLYYILNAVFDCSRSAINKALLTPLGGYTDTSILHTDEEALLMQFKRYQDTWKDKGVYVMLHQFIADYELNQKLYDPSAEQPERRVVNIHQLVEILHKIAFKKKLNPEELLQWFKKGMEGEAREGDEYEQRIESDQDAVQIVTIHKSKGLEYNIVLAPHLDLLAEPPHFNTSSFRDPEGDTYPVVVRLPMAKEQPISALQSIYVSTQAGGSVPLTEVATPRLKSVPSQINRYQLERTVTVKAYNDRGSLASKLNKDVIAKLERTKLPAGITWQVGGAAEVAARNTAGLGGVILFALFGIAVAGGMFVVPLYAFLTTVVDKSETARTIAANNIVNSGAMVVAVLSLGAMTSLGVTIEDTLVLIAASCVVSAWIAWKLNKLCD